MAIHHCGRKREERSHAQTTLFGPRNPREGHKRLRSQSTACAPEQNRAAAGYKSWDDYQTEIKMAKAGTNAERYINDLIVGIQPKFDSEVAELQKLKAADTSDPNAKIEVWDWRYYSNQRNKQKYDVDKEALRAYFPFQRVLDGMFNIYQSIFGLKFEKIAVPYKWIDDLQLYMVTDSSTGEPLGMFYLDML